MMSSRFHFLTIAVFAAIHLSFLPAVGFAGEEEPIDDETCAVCHDGSDPDIPAVTADQLADSVHDGFSCTDCHSDIIEIPHPDHLKSAACRDCHDEEFAAYRSHGRGAVGTTPDLPTCSSCHGTHGIRAVDDPESLMSPARQAGTCAVCHDNPDLARAHDIQMKAAASRFEESIHARAGREGKSVPTCTHCHGTDGTAHDILPPTDPESSIYHFNIPATCGQCHQKILEAYREGIHGQLTAEGDTHSPVCTDCHGEHAILSVADPRSNVNPTNIAKSTCEPCHESARLNAVYGVAAGELVSFVDTYHGLKSRSGDATVANCASCHGAHRILPSSDPGSSVNPANLPTTCGKCHPRISAAFASTPIHTQLESVSYWPAFVARLYLWLIVVVIGGMAAFVALDFVHGFRKKLDGRQVRRMTPGAVLQHTLLMVSFIVLVYTGFALRYSEAWLFNKAFAWDGGFHTRGIIHRIAAGVFLFTTAWHVIYLFTAPGRRFLADMAPGLRDVHEAKGTILNNLGLTATHPRFGRFTFAEKAEYWALVWGTAVMAFTGLFLWFDPVALRLFSKNVLDVLRVIHLYEAWLATLAILVWHLYGVIFKPAVYPGNPSWLTGRMPAAMHEAEHPGEIASPVRRDPKSPESTRGKEAERRPVASRR